MVISILLARQAQLFNVLCVLEKLELLVNIDHSRIMRKILIKPKGTLCWDRPLYIISRRKIFKRVSEPDLWSYAPPFILWTSLVVVKTILLPKLKIDKFRFLSILNLFWVVVWWCKIWRSINFIDSFHLIASFCLFAASIMLNYEQIVFEMLTRNYTCKYHTLILHLDFV